MKNALSKSLFALLVSVSLLVSSCGGGGGGSSDSGGGDGLSNNACESLGLNARIINGTECSTTDSPVVRISLIFKDGTTASCSGTMLTQTHVLSAGHCFPAEVRSATITANGRRVDGVRYFRHPGYNATNQALFKDVAILELGSNAGLPTVPLMVSSAASSGDTIKIFGFGLDENGGAGVLKSGEMRVNDVTTDHLITSFDGEGSNTCSGDSGGPALLVGANGIGIVGITSSGFLTDCGVGDTSLFANTQSAEYLNFIRETVPGAAVL
jgi:secreted trypsin-like serine protease